MARAFKCDRCGGFYSPTSKEIKYGIFDYDNELKSIDLCPNCREDFMNWFESGVPFTEKGKRNGK